MSVVALGLLAVFAPVIVTPFAKFWYERGFEGAVVEAMKVVPGSESACIYDDTRNMFVTSIDELDVSRMIETAVNNKFPIPHDPPHIDPHFRIYSGGQTYYWSFGDEEFKRFNRKGFSLLETGASLCESYRMSPDSYRSTFKERSGISVTEMNFCCTAE